MAHYDPGFRIRRNVREATLDESPLLPEIYGASVAMNTDVCALIRR
ncbi:MAG: hypothetical protein NVS4B3_21960 [Gemmatimonadaceae bacterium]